MPTLQFSHPALGPLTIDTGIDSAAWGYSLNTVTYPTYGGDVIQILSCQVDNLELSGTFGSYAQMESFYTYMMKYMQVATQGRVGERVPGQTSFSQETMKFLYPERGWVFDIMPTSAPGFRRGTEVVAPTWQLEAHIVDHIGDADSVADLIISEAEIGNIVGGSGKFQESFGLKGVIGYDPDNPFSDPFTEEGPTFDLKEQMSKEAKKTGEAYVQLIGAYISKNFASILPEGASKPVKNADEVTDAANQITGVVLSAAGAVVGAGASLFVEDGDPDDSKDTKVVKSTKKTRKK